MLHLPNFHLESLEQFTCPLALCEHFIHEGVSTPFGVFRNQPHRAVEITLEREMKLKNLLHSQVLESEACNDTRAT